MSSVLLGITQEGPSLTWARGARMKELGEGFSHLKDLGLPLLAVSRAQEVGHACQVSADVIY